MHQKFETQLREQERDELLKRLAGQIFGGAQQIRLAPGPLSHQNVGVIAGVLVWLFGPAHTVQNTCFRLASIGWRKLTAYRKFCNALT